jgi:hypothetical protein
METFQWTISLRTLNQSEGSKWLQTIQSASTYPRLPSTQGSEETLDHNVRPSQKGLLTSSAACFYLRHLSLNSSRGSWDTDVRAEEDRAATHVGQVTDSTDM